MQNANACIPMQNTDACIKVKKTDFGMHTGMHKGRRLHLQMGLWGRVRRRSSHIDHVWSKVKKVGGESLEVA